MALSKGAWLAIGLGLVVVAVASSASGGPSAPVPPQPAPPPPADPTIASTGGSLTTRQAQQMLKDLGPVAGDSNMSNLAVDGAVGPATTQATKDFQSIKGITVDGIIGPQTATTLYNTWLAAGFGPALPAQ